MGEHQAAIVAAPVDVVEHALSDVRSWPAFLTGVESVAPLGHQRYRFCLTDGRDRREVVVLVRRLPGEHRVTWQALEGPAFSGRWQLRAVDERHTEVQLRLVTHPGTLFAGLAEMVMPRGGRAERVLQGLEENLLTAVR